MTASIAHWLWRWLGALFSAGEFVLKGDGAWGLKSDGSWALFNASNACDECCETNTVNCTAGCVDDLAPEQYQLDVIGMTNNVCEDCDTFNGTFLIDFSFFCSWTSSVLAGGICECTAGEALWLVDISGTSSTNTVGAGGCGMGLQAYRQNFSPGKCCGLSNENLPFSSATTNQCNWGDATVDITSVGC